MNVELLKKTCEVPGAPGFERLVRALVIDEVEPLVDQLEVDNMGSVIALKKGSPQSRRQESNGGRPPRRDRLHR